MTRSARLRLLTAACLCLALVACEGFTVGEILDDIAAVDTDLSASPDPAVQAAAASAQAIRDEKLAQESAKVALETNDAEAMFEAAALRPNDPSYAVMLSAMLRAGGDELTAAHLMRESLELMQENGLRVADSYRMVADGYLKVRDTYERGSVEWERANEIFCEALRTYTSTSGSSASALGDSLFTVLTYPAQDCS